MIHNVSIVIPTLGNYLSLKRLVESIARQDYNIKTFEVIIVINGASKVDEEKLETLKTEFAQLNIKLISIAVRGVNRARNEGLDAATHEIVVFFDDDCELQRKNFISEHVKFHEKNDGFSYGGGYLLSSQSGYFDELYHRIQMEWLLNGLLSESNNVSHLLGGNFSIKKSVAESYQLRFDNSITYGGSEYEFFKHAEQLGLNMYMNEFDVLHYTDENMVSLTKKIFRQGSGKAYIDRKYQLESKNTSQKKTEVQNAVSYDIVRVYFNYVFWLGYYHYTKSYYKIFFHVFVDLIKKINYLRFRFLNKITQEIGNKKNKGDRF